MKRILSLSLLCLLAACDPDPKPTDPKAPASAPLAQAQALIEKQDYAGATAVLEAARGPSGEDPAIVKRLVDLYKAQNDPARAIQRARAGLDAHPDAKELYLPLANLYFSVKQIDTAQALLVEAVKRGVDDSGVELSLGACLAAKEDVPGARAAFERAEAKGADAKTVAMNLALLLVQENKPAEALAAFEAAHAKYPDMAGPKREIGRLLLAEVSAAGQAGKPLDKPKVDRAMDLLWGVKDELKNDWRMHEAMGDGWLLLGDYDASLLAYTDALKLGQNPKSVEDRYRVAKKLSIEAKAAAEQSEPK